MIIIRNLNQLKSLPNLSLTIGNFDGIHLGHLKIIEEVKKSAKEKNLFSAILTFEPHPIAFFNPEKSKNYRINNLSQKLRIFKENNIDYAIILPFNEVFSQISAINFIEILANQLNTKHLIIGYDFTFGKNREGNFNLLSKNSKDFGFSLQKIEEIQENNKTYSSTIIRKLITNGEILNANKFLSKNFTMSGVVIEGKKLASKINFPTMNLNIKPNLIMPKFGVYKTKTFIPHLNQSFNSITNFGIKPTVNNSQIPLLETHIPNFVQNTYGKKIFVEFLDFIREEKKFNSLEELQEQIKKDILKI